MTEKDETFAAAKRFFACAQDDGKAETPGEREGLTGVGLKNRMSTI
jgi:hypothetical protein